ncbi:MAG: hypothetical protein WEC59_11910 [Salibacteraceae bacterium]
MHRSIFMLCLMALITYSCSEDCSNVEAELAAAKEQITMRDSTLDQIGRTFGMIDSNLLSIKQVEAELMQQMRAPGKDKSAIQQNVQKMKGIMEMNQSFIDQLQNNLRASSATTTTLFTIIHSMEDRMLENNLRLARLNHDLGVLGEDFKGLFDEYMQAEVSKMVLEENFETMKGSVSEMEAKVKLLKNQLSTVYVAYGSKRELVESGVLDKGNFLKAVDVNDDMDKAEFKPYHKEDLNELNFESSKTKIVTDHPSESYQLLGNKLIIKDNDLFWSISKFLIVVTD